MIVVDRGKYFECIPQHEHARISYEAAKRWADVDMTREKSWNYVKLAVREHDCAWVILDAYPDYHNEKNAPYSFIDYPLEKKLNAYREGIAYVCCLHPYSGLLCSLHYSSFFRGSSDDRGKSFRQEEIKRQKDIRNRVDTQHEDEHLLILQFCDDLSLYACLNKPGAMKEEEITWFRSGFRQTFSFLKNQTIKAAFSSENCIQWNPFPFTEPFQIVIRGSAVDKKKIETIGWNRAYKSSKPMERNFRFVSN
ncbi:DUF3891 family protein [Alteribacillus sp. HJP-4]|uniref:DUF3891 family protein n=1 Tax=Alteribacillus sp. HJP-4 TaxID=2775394 RepID=UPI0035CCFCF7